MATSAYHEWIRTQEPLDRWALRLAVLAGNYDAAADRTMCAYDESVIDAEDRLREMADQAAHTFAPRHALAGRAGATGGPFRSSATIARPGAARRVFLAAQCAGAAWGLLGRIAARGADPRGTRARGAARSYGQAMDDLREELRLCRVPS